MLPVTLARVPHHTKESINEKIRVETEDRVAACRSAGPAAISARLHELREEWDIDRACELHGGIVAVGGATLGAAVDKRFFAIPVVIGASLIAGALFGWSPQYAILRRLGFRTAGEIERERTQLLAIAAESDGGRSVFARSRLEEDLDELRLDDVP
jgi:hypothetical protein